jgi:hypothetical protein
MWLAACPDPLSTLNADDDIDASADVASEGAGGASLHHKRRMEAVGGLHAAPGVSSGVFWRARRSKFQMAVNSRIAVGIGVPRRPEPMPPRCAHAEGHTHDAVVGECRPVNHRLIAAPGQ